jgi:hypothetical protein
MLRERHLAMQRWVVQPVVRVLIAVRPLLRLTGVMALVCGCASTKPAKDASEETSDDDTEEPEACRPTAGKAFAAALGGFSQGVNGGSNQALEMQQERCRQARDAQRFNAEHRARVAELELEQQRIELERQRLELERRRAAAEEQTRAESATRGSADPSPSGTDALLIFGGPDHKTFLGCLCDPKDESSVFNDDGKYGRNGLNLDQSSLWAPLGIYRSIFSDYSACAMFAKDPPIVVTSEGAPLCRLTTNQTNAYQCRAPQLIEWLSKGPCAQ